MMIFYQTRKTSTESHHKSRTLLSVAEMERDMIIERTQAGKVFAKQHNLAYGELLLGRPLWRFVHKPQFTN